MCNLLLDIGTLFSIIQKLKNANFNIIKRKIVKIFSKSSFINCTLDELFAFHMNVNNIKKITPSNIKVELLDHDTRKFECRIHNIRTTKYFIPFHWKIKIDKKEKPNILVDCAVQSPFKVWCHQHIFTQKGNVCELKDVIEYEIGYGVLGKIVSPFVEYELNSIFDYRHIQTKKILEK